MGFGFVFVRWLYNLINFKRYSVLVCLLHVVTNCLIIDIVANLLGNQLGRLVRRLSCFYDRKSV